MHPSIHLSIWWQTPSALTITTSNPPRNSHCKSQRVLTSFFHSGVAVGSSIGHAIGGFFGGGSSSAPPAEQQQYQQPIDNYAQPGSNAMYNANSAAQAETSGPCANDIKSFQTCMNQNGSDLNICGWYLEQLKACQAAARPY